MFYTFPPSLGPRIKYFAFMSLVLFYWYYLPVFGPLYSTVWFCDACLLFSQNMSDSDSDIDLDGPPAKRKKLIDSALAVLQFTTQADQQKSATPAPVPELSRPFWDAAVHTNSCEYPPDAGLSRAVLRAIHSDQYVDYRDLAGAEKIDKDYKISFMDWSLAHAKYMLIKGATDPTLLWKLTSYQSVILHIAKSGWVQAAQYDKLFREARFARSVRPEDRDQRYPWNITHQSTQFLAASFLAARNKKSENAIASNQVRFRGKASPGAGRTSLIKGMCFEFQRTGACRRNESCPWPHKPPVGIAHSSRPSLKSETSGTSTD